MITTRRGLLALTGATAVMAMMGCSSSSTTEIKVGASPVPHARILGFIKDNLAARAGISLTIVEYDDYVQPNEALASKELDANYFQHLPYLEDQIAERRYPFAHGAGIHIEPYAAFSKKYQAVADIPEGAAVAITNDASNQARGLKVLESVGLLKDVTLKTSVVSLTPDQNPKKLQFKENQPEIIVQQIDDPEIDVAMVNGNFILSAGLSTEKALAVEKVEGNPYANILVWRKDDAKPGVAKLDELLHSSEVADFIRTTWPSGDVTPGA
ncbi:MAG: MetQ/NlpA family ABC transporter substrate-binding protein [Actinomycetia bacterium]|nr:MetQ/NlpA family ABC transporter substrate-binding protein [Actinomycetes bacterium]